MIVSKNTWRPGALLLEVVIGLALSVLFAVAIVNMSLGTFTSVGQSRDQLVATNYGYEGLESIRTISRQDFDALEHGTHGVYHVQNNQYVLSGSSVTWGKYTMSITLQPLYRDASESLILPSADTGAVLAAGGWEDPQAKLATATVTWEASGQPKQVQVQTMFTKWFVYPLQTLSATGALAGSEYEFYPIDGNIYPIWRALFWNADGGIYRMQLRFGSTYADVLTQDWIGPDGGTGTYYGVNGSGIYSPSVGSDRWIQGKAILTGTGTAAPVMTVLYE